MFIILSLSLVVSCVYRIKTFLHFYSVKYFTHSWIPQESVSAGRFALVLLFTPFNPSGENHSNCSYHIWDTADTSCWARAEERMFINVYSLLKGASANIIAHTPWLLGYFSKAVPGCKPCSLVYYTFKIRPEFSKGKRFPRKDANI